MSENFANYMNSRDMTNSVDEAILNPIFDVLHGRIDEDDEEIKTNL
jgi:hypothetical protein